MTKPFPPIVGEAEVRQVFMLSGRGLALIMNDGVTGAVPHHGLISSDTATVRYRGPEFARVTDPTGERIVVIIDEADKPHFLPGTKVRFHQRGVRAQIVRWVDSHQPGFVECHLIDRFGREWSFIEKLPVISLLDLDGCSSYPQPCVIACEIMGRDRDTSGREFVMIDTERPWAVSSVEGAHEFEVFTDQIVDA
jgi:hypothetical protein